MSKGMNWDKAKRRELVQRRGSLRVEDMRSPAKQQKRGITNPQAKLLADLQRQLGEKYSGAGMTCAEASNAIDACFARLGRPRKRAA